MYEISNSKHCSLLQLYVPDDSGCYWNFGTRRRLYDAEIAEFTVLTPILNSIVFSLDEDDELVWVGEFSGAFSVKSAYQLDTLTTSNPSFPRKKIWSNAWPHKIGFFLWQLVLDSLPTIDNLQHRNCALSVFGGSSATNLCSLCNNVLESGTHLFWNCRFTH